MGKQKGVLSGFLEFCENPADSSGDVGEGFPFWRSVAEQIPSGGFPADVEGRSSLVAAIVPLREIGVDPESLPESREFGGVARPGEGARQDETRVK